MVLDSGFTNVEVINFFQWRKGSLAPNLKTPPQGPAVISVVSTGAPITAFLRKSSPQKRPPVRSAFSLVEGAGFVGEVKQGADPWKFLPIRLTSKREGSATGESRPPKKVKTKGGIPTGLES